MSHPLFSVTLGTPIPLTLKLAAPPEFSFVFKKNCYHDNLEVILHKFSHVTVEFENLTFYPSRAHPYL